MDQQTPNDEGTAVPTPPTGMSPEGSAPTADPKVEAKSAEVLFAEEALGREFTSKEDAQKTLVNLNRLVGDQTVSKQRKALETLAEKSGLTVEELVEVAASGEIDAPQAMAEMPVETPSVRTLPDANTSRLVRVEVTAFTKDNPEAALVKDALFAKALSTGKSVDDVWASEFAPLIETGKKIGAKKLQQNLEGQPVKATSTASEETDTKVDFSGLNPTTGKRWTAGEMERFIGYAAPSNRL